MTRANPLADKEAITAFGKNVFTCCEIATMTIESLGIRTEIDPHHFHDYLSGTRDLIEEDIKAVSMEFGIDAKHLVHNHGNLERCKMMMRSLLSKSNYRALSTVVAEKSSEAMGEENITQGEVGISIESQGEVLPPKENAVPTEVTKDSIVEDDMAQDVTSADAAKSNEIIWEENDLTGTTAGGVKFDLHPKAMRAIVIGRIRGLIENTDKTFSGINAGAKLNKASSWWRNVETGATRIYGTEVESIAEFLGISAYELISGSKDVAQAPEPPTQAIETLPESEMEAEIAAPVVTILPPEPELVAETPPAVEITPEPEVLPPTHIALEVRPEDSTRQEYFRCLVLNANTKPASGATIGQLLELARDQAGVDWESTYMNLTGAGEDLSETIADIQEKLRPYDNPIRNIILQALSEHSG